MNRETSNQVRDLIEARFLAVADKGLTCCLQREIETAVDMAGLCGAIEIEEQRHYKERLNKLEARNHEQWKEQLARIG